jgi:hypothetical protein
MGENAAASEPYEYAEPLMDNVAPDQGQVYASPILNPAVPTAQMLPLRHTATVSIAQPESAQTKDAQASAPRSASITASADEDDADVSDNERLSNVQTRSGRLPQFKRRYTSGQETPLTKKQMIARAKRSVPELQGPAFSTRRRTRGAIDDEEDSCAYPSPPLVQHDTSSGEQVTPNFPNVTHTRSNDEEIRDTMRGNSSEVIVVASEQDVRSNSGSSVEDAIIVDLQDDPIITDAGHDNFAHAHSTDIDSDAPLRPRTSKKSPAKLAPRRLVVPIKVTAPSEDDEYLRQRLASKLLDILPKKLQQPNALLLSGTLSLLESRFKIEHLRIQKFYPKEFLNHKESFERWTECLRHVIQFYSSTKFNGNLSTRPDFLKTIPFERKAVLMSPFFHGRPALTEWREKRGMSVTDIANEVGSLLFHLAPWDDWVDLQEVQQMTLGFTEDLLAWFNQASR